MNARWRAPAGLHTSSVRLPLEGELPSFGGTDNVRRAVHETRIEYPVATDNDYGVWGGRVRRRRR